MSIPIPLFFYTFCTLWNNHTTQNTINHTPRSASMKLTDKIYLHKKRSIYTLLMLSYISILLLALSSNLIYYNQIRKQIASQTELSRQLLLTQLHTSVEADTSAVEALCTELAFDKNLYNYAKGLPNITYSDVKSSLSSKLHHNDVIYDYLSILKIQMKSLPLLSECPLGNFMILFIPLLI